MVARYQHVTDDVHSGIADRVGSLLWDITPTNLNTQ
jgi:hypothetical protein